MTIRTQLKAGGVNLGNHNEALQVRTALKAGGWFNHNEALQVRSALKAGGTSLNHSETLQRASERRETLESATDIVWMRRQPLTRSRNEDRLTLLVVRAGLRAGRRARGRARH